MRAPLKRWPGPKRTVPVRDEVTAMFAALTEVPDCWCPDEGLYSDGYTILETQPEAA